MSRLKGKVAFITGASRGLGKALANAYAREGASLSLCARGEKELQEVTEEMKKLGSDVLMLVGDVSDPHDVERMVSLTEEYFGHIDILVNNASILGPSPMPYLIDYPAEDFAQVLKVNTIGPFLVTRQVIRGMLQRNEGTIINITSEAGSVGYAGWGAYGISKFAVEGLTETWASEVEDTAIRVNMVDPGEMNTRMHALAVPEANPEDYPLPEENVNVFIYLASDESIQVSGQRFEAQAYEAR
jgi:NAD(P)-dependent dehydrogenase (short-subunit alcohol dehydrogenase family)